MVTRTETRLVTLKIDDQDVTVPAGTTILQAAEAAGIEVPNLCFQPLLRPWGSCRLCTVEILGSRGGLIESCAAPVREGMEVATLSERVVESRQFILQMYLIDHALDCPTCDKSGECYLQDNTYLHNVNANPYRRPKLAQPYQHFSETIDYKWDRCIMCNRCTRVCDEMVGVIAIEAANRGLERAGIGWEDIEVAELNEAFAAQSLAVIKMLELNPDKVNVNGGAIALGHPLGCTGAKLTATILRELERRNGRYGMVTMCVGGGMGAAGILERLS